MSTKHYFTSNKEETMDCLDGLSTALYPLLTDVAAHDGVWTSDARPEGWQPFEQVDGWEAGHAAFVTAGATKKYRLSPGGEPSFAGAYYEGKSTLDFLANMSHPDKESEGEIGTHHQGATAYFRLGEEKLKQCVLEIYGADFTEVLVLDKYCKAQSLGWNLAAGNSRPAGGRSHKNKPCCHRTELVGLVRIALAVCYMETGENMTGINLSEDVKGWLGMTKVVKEKKAKVAKVAKVVKEKKVEEKKVKSGNCSGAQVMKVALGAKDVRFLKPLLKKVNDMKNIDEMLEILQARKKELEAAEKEHWATIIQKMYRGFRCRQAMEPVPESESDDDSASTMSLDDESE